ncbi:MAG: triple tyrosine motif-containing protein [Anaerobacillus sp.]|uniref:triple tyrosine motif-containing protein n=1 Tax=Anaerobacillus sp. TaxID=1872506 RepID=UPI003919071C
MWKWFSSLVLMALLFFSTFTVVTAGDVISFSSNQFSIVNETEPNDSFELANIVKANQEINGILSDEEDRDYYKLTLPYKGKFTGFIFLPEDLYGYYDYDLRLYDAEGNYITKSTFYYFYDEEEYEYYYYQEISRTLESGTYYLSVQTDDYYVSNVGYKLFTDVEFQPGYSHSISTSVASPQVVNTAITISAKSSKSDLEYEFSINGKVVQKFSNSKTYSWKPTKSGKYTIKVRSRDVQNKEVILEKELSYTINKYTPDFKITELTSDVKGPQIKGKTITFTTKADKKGLQYQYSVNDKVVQKYSTNNKFKWTPSKTGKYTIKVEVRRPEHPNSPLSKKMTYEIKDGNVKITSLKANKQSPHPTNTTIKWTAKAEGVDLEYKFSAYQNKKWVTIQNYSSKNTANWKPTTAGDYKVKVEVRSKASGKKATREAKYKIFKPSSFSISSFKSDQSLKQAAGTFNIFTVKSTGSYLEYRYRIKYYGQWYTVQDYSSDKTFYWTPPESGKFTVAVDVRQRGTTKKQTKTVTLDVRERPNFYMNTDYYIHQNYGYFTVQNYGYSNLKVNKIELINNDKVIYTHSPKDWITIGRRNDTFYFYPKNKLTQFNYSTVIKAHYTYDGVSHIQYLYR